ncbi:MAG: hypothetical protein ACLRTQ_06805 [Candidatus Borkfalkia sp.]
MQSEPLLSVILNIENSQENLNRSLGALFACKNERPVEVRAAVRAGKFAAPQILSVYQRSSALFSFTSAAKNPRTVRRKGDRKGCG